MAVGKAWTREEVVVALALYLSRPFGSLRSTNPDVQAVARILNRTPGSVSRKIGNLGSFDSTLKASGLPHAARMDQMVWDEFIGDRTGMQPIDIVFREASIIASHEFHADLSFLAAPPKETERLAERRERLSAGFFRAAVISNYNGRCALTGLNSPQLIEAAHILPWAQHDDLRLVPANGLSLCTLLHRAYDSDLLGIDADGLAHVSRRLRSAARGTSFEAFFESLDERARLCEPRRFEPSAEFLSLRYSEYLAAQKNGAFNEKAAACICAVRR